MHATQILEKTDGYLNSEWRDSRAPWIKPPEPFVTISRECCAGGSELARLLAELLNQEAAPAPGWRIFGGNVINQMLRTNRMSEELARYLPEDKIPEVNAAIGEMVGLHPSLWELQQKAIATMRQLARGGRVILVGRGANHATAALPGGTHVRLFAPAADRARYYAHRFQVSEAQAYLHNAKCDTARRRYVAANFNIRSEDPSSFDLMINTAHVSLTEAAQIIAAHVRKLSAVAA